jgi:hypothetical protein
MKVLTLILSVFLTVVLELPGQHEGHQNHESHTQAPIGVMGDHLHPEGEWMFSYRYMQMHMDTNKDGHHEIKEIEVLQSYMVAPKWMSMEMHMFGGMYAFNDDLTLMVMLPYIKKTMGHMNRMYVDFNTHSAGLGDTKVTALHKLLNTGSGVLHLNIGASLPSGSIDERDSLATDARVRLPYPMQLGSGTVDPIVGFTYNDNFYGWNWGAQAVGTFRTRKNRHSYKLGHEYEGSVWASHSWTKACHQSLRVKWQLWEDIHEQDPRQNAAMAPTMDPDLRAGKRVDLLMGVDWEPKSGTFKDQRFSFEGGFPIHENLDGPQLSTKFQITGGWQIIF